MAAAISPGTGRAYGVARVCDGFGVPRSSFYAWRRQQECTDPPLIPSRRGPKPAISDAALVTIARATRSTASIGQEQSLGYQLLSRLPALPQRKL